MFTQFVAMAQDGSCSMTERGLDALLDIFEHLTQGGSLYDFPDENFPPEALIGILATSWLDVRDMVDIKRRLREQYGD